MIKPLLPRWHARKAKKEMFPPEHIEELSAV
jgi:hypothetical protein